MSAEGVAEGPGDQVDRGDEDTAPLEFCTSSCQGLLAGVGEGPTDPGRSALNPVPRSPSTAGSLDLFKLLSPFPLGPMLSALWLGLLLLSTGLFSSDGSSSKETNTATVVRGRMPDYESRVKLSKTVEDMYDHAFGSYMRHAFPWDELRPLSCDGRRVRERGDLDAMLGNYSMTLIDALDSLAVFGRLADLEMAVEHISSDEVKFDLDLEVSTFEVNIRILGGLLSGHLHAQRLLEGYTGSLLLKALDIGTRLLRAFDTTTGLPLSRINLRRGKPMKVSSHVTVAEAGSFLVEFGVLSRLSGDWRFYETARTSILTFWHKRSARDMVGTTIDVDNGAFQDMQSTTGPGQDSFFEYLLKGYILFDDLEMLDVFWSAYSAVEVHQTFEGFTYNVDMFKGLMSNAHLSPLSCVWASVQILAGDVAGALRSVLYWYTLWARHGALPEVFDTKSEAPTNVRDSPLRPELAEAVFYLSLALPDDPTVFWIASNLIAALNSDSRVACGFAAVADVTTKRLDDRMDSFFLSETLVYLYLAVAPRKEVEKALGLSLGEVVFSTEGHIFPIKAVSRHAGIEVAVENFANQRLPQRPTPPSAVGAAAEAATPTTTATATTTTKATNAIDADIANTPAARRAAAAKPRPKAKPRAAVYEGRSVKSRSTVPQAMGEYERPDIYPGLPDRPLLRCEAISPFERAALQQRCQTKYFMTASYQLQSRTLSPSVCPSQEAVLQIRSGNNTLDGPVLMEIKGLAASFGPPFPQLSDSLKPALRSRTQQLSLDFSSYSQFNSFSSRHVKGFDRGLSAAVGAAAATSAAAAAIASSSSSSSSCSSSSCSPSAAVATTAEASSVATAGAGLVYLPEADDPHCASAARNASEGISASSSSSSSAASAAAVSASSSSAAASSSCSSSAAEGGEGADGEAHPCQAAAGRKRPRRLFRPPPLPGELALARLDLDLPPGRLPPFTNGGNRHFELRQLLATRHAVVAEPLDACSMLRIPPGIEAESVEKYYEGKIVFITRGNCLFLQKFHRLQKLWVSSVVVIDQGGEENSDLKVMTCPLQEKGGGNDVNIPTMMISREEGMAALTLLKSTTVGDGSLSVRVFSAQ